jgi:hypothetical protein
LMQRIVHLWLAWTSLYDYSCETSLNKITKVQKEGCK